MHDGTIYEGKFKNGMLEGHGEMSKKTADIGVDKYFKRTVKRNLLIMKMKQFLQMKKMMSKLMKGGMGNIMNMMKGIPGMKGMM